MGGRVEVLMNLINFRGYNEVVEKKWWLRINPVITGRTCKLRSVVE